MAKKNSRRTSKQAVNKLIDYSDRVAAGLAGTVGYFGALFYLWVDWLPTPWLELMMLAVAVALRAGFQKLYVCRLVPWLVRRYRDLSKGSSVQLDVTERELVENDRLPRIIYIIVSLTAGTAILLSKAGWSSTSILWACTAITFGVGYLEHWSDIRMNLKRREINGEPTAKPEKPPRKPRSSNEQQQISSRSQRRKEKSRERKKRKAGAPGQNRK